MLPEAFTPEFLSRLELMRIHTRRAFLGARQGGHTSLKRGHGIEFSDYRMYELGDSPRHIDWGVYARSDRLYVKRFREEQSLSVLFILDGSRSMTALAAERKWDRAVEITLALAYVALMNQDSVYVSVIGGMHRGPYYGARAIHALARDLAAPSETQPVEVMNEIQRAAARIRFPGVSVFISDFIFPVPDAIAFFQALQSRNLDITAIQVLGPADINPFKNNAEVVAVDSEDAAEIEISFGTSERNAYQALLKKHQAELREYTLSQHIRLAELPSAIPLEDAIFGELLGGGLLSS
jgi:uncharacterized protein (DUF58 family)